MPLTPNDIDMDNREFIDRDRPLPVDPANVGAVDQRSNDTSRADADAAPIGTPPMDFDVRSTYDVRPINGYDFNEIGSFTLGEAPTNTVPTGSKVFFTVPFGLVGVMRRLRVWFEPSPGFIYPSESLLTIQQNGQDVNDNIDIPYGDGGEWVDCFVIADELQTLGVRIAFAAVASVPGTMYLHAYGNYLLKTGRPSNFEIANPVGQKRAPPEPVKAMPLPALPRTPIMSEPLQAPDNNSSLMRTPPFTVEWTRMNLLGSAGRNKNTPRAQWTPIKIVNGQKFNLSTDDMVMYRDFLAASKPNY